MYNISDENYIDYSNTTKNNILFIGVSASRRKPPSGLTSGAGRQYEWLAGCDWAV